LGGEKRNTKIGDRFGKPRKKKQAKELPIKKKGGAIPGKKVTRVQKREVAKKKRRALTGEKKAAKPVPEIQEKGLLHCGKIASCNS